MPTGYYYTVRVDTSFSVPFKFNFEIKSGGWLFWKDSIEIITNVEDEQSLPVSYKLYQNFPNPFNPTTNIGFRIAEGGFVTLKIYDVLGSEIATLVNEEKPAGTYELTWNAVYLPSGIYFYQLKSGKSISTKKMILLK